MTLARVAVVKNIKIVAVEYKYEYKLYQHSNQIYHKTIFHYLEQNREKQEVYKLATSTDKRKSYLSWPLLIGTGFSIVLFVAVGNFGAFMLLSLFYAIYYCVLCYHIHQGYQKYGFITGRYILSAITGFIWFHLVRLIYKIWGKCFANVDITLYSRFDSTSYYTYYRCP